MQRFLWHRSSGFAKMVETTVGGGHLGREVSPFEGYVRERLERANRAWPREWNRCLEEARPALAELRRLGGDDRFVLFVLANYRWRRIVPFAPLQERRALLAQIARLLGNQSAWFQFLRQNGGEAWKAAEEELRQAKARLLSVQPHDMSAFEATHTSSVTRGPRWQGGHAYTCLWVLDWHLKQLPGLGRIRRRLLGDLLFPFGFLGRSKNTILLVAQRLRRNPRVRKGHRFLRNATLAHLIRMYHRAHSEAQIECGLVCRAWPEVLSFTPPARAHRWTERALKLEGRKRHRKAAHCYQAALEEAEKVLGWDHRYVAWILVRYWLALRHAGQHGRAAKIKARADAMWAKYGAGTLST
jgi:hypothetical protein